MTKTELIDQLIDCQALPIEQARNTAETLLLIYIGDPGITEAFQEVIRLNTIKGLMICPDILEEV